MHHATRSLAFSLLATALLGATGCGSTPSENDAVDAGDTALADGSDTSTAADTTPDVAADTAEPDAIAEDVADPDVSGPDAGLDVIEDTAPDVQPDAGPAPTGLCTVEGSGLPPSSDLTAEPGETIRCSGAVDDPDQFVEYLWSVVERPSGSTTAFTPNNAAETSFHLDTVGTYTFELVVVDDRGNLSAPTQVVVTVRPSEALYVQLVWTTTDAPADTKGAELGLHLRHPNGCWNDPVWDCTSSNENPEWGDVGTIDDNPTLTSSLRTSVSTIAIPDPQAVSYTIAVGLDDARGYTEAYATVRVYLYGELLFEMGDKRMSFESGSDSVWWAVASVDPTTASVTPLDTTSATAPACD